MSFDALAKIDMMDIFNHYILPYGCRLIMAVLIVAFGLWGAWWLRRTVNRALTLRNVESTVRIFICHLVYALTITLVLIAGLAGLGVQTTSLVAVIGAAVFAIAFALKNSLSSLASGILLVVFRPFKVGDNVIINNTNGIVKEVQLMFTRLATSDNTTVWMPNGLVASQAITNLSHYPTRRQDIVLTLDYSADLAKTRAVLQALADNDSRVQKNPAPEVAVQELSVNGMSVRLRYWTDREQYNKVETDLWEAIKLRFDQENIPLTASSQVRKHND